jgi:hypothetical protein
MSKAFTVRPVAQTGAWSTDHRRHFDYAARGLEELIPLAEEVVRQWPADAAPLLQVDRMPQGLHELCRRRDHLSDSVALFAAIAVEAFINYYGLVRLGEDQFNRHFERLPIRRKLELLLLVCDGVELEVQDPINRALRNVVERRNRLAHPKAKQVSPDQPPEERVKEAIPEGARASVDAMKAFSQEFVGLVPGSRHMIPGQRVA